MSTRNLDQNQNQDKNQNLSQNTNQSKSEKNTEVAEALRLVLADTFVLYMKTYAVHWNYQGPKFFSVHKMTEEHYEQLAEAIDEIAERIRALGKAAPISLDSMLAKSDLEETRLGNTNDDQALLDLVSAHQLLSQRAQEAAEICGNAGDLYSQDIMVGRIGEHDKAAWMLRSFMQQGDRMAQEKIIHS